MRLKPGQVPLERALSKLGIASRTQAHEWILTGKVRVNGMIRRQPQYGVNPEKAKIEIDGQRIERAEPRHFILYKPRGTITTRSDEKGRPTVFSLIQEKSLHLCAVGRLDWATSGLLLLTNDTRLSDWLTDPKNKVPRSYVLTVRGKMTEEEIQRCCSGIVDKGEELSADEITLQKASGKESHLVVTLTEGKNREIRRMFQALGHEVIRLKRVSYGNLTLGNLEPGKYREITTEELLSAFPDAPIRRK